MSNTQIIREIIKNRRNTKEFLEKDVSKELIEFLLECGTWAPNHRNTEPWRFFVVNRESKARKYIAQGMIDLRQNMLGKELSDNQKNSIQTQINGFPVIIFVLSVVDANDEITEQNYAATCCAIQNMQLAAESVGLGIGWSTGNIAKIETLHRMISSEIDLKMVGVLSVGYPASKVEKMRTGFKELTRWL